MRACEAISWSGIEEKLGASQDAAAIDILTLLRVEGSGGVASLSVSGAGTEDDRWVRNRERGGWDGGTEGPSSRLRHPLLELLVVLVVVVILWLKQDSLTPLGLTWTN